MASNGSGRRARSGARGGKQQSQSSKKQPQNAGKLRPGVHSSTLHGGQSAGANASGKSAGQGKAVSGKSAASSTRGTKPAGGKAQRSGNSGGGKSAGQNRARGKKSGAKVKNKGEHIVMVGFMGSGKSSVSRVLAKRTGLPLIDVDKHIEQTQGRKIKQIFAEEGEAGFRRIETQAMAALAFEPKSIISCGGGIVGSAVNRAIVKALGTVVYLEVPCDEAVGRISDPSTRPMLNGERPVQEIYDERLPLYRDVADITINTSGKSVGQNVGQVLGVLKRKGLL